MDQGPSSSRPTSCPTTPTRRHGRARIAWLAAAVALLAAGCTAAAGAQGTSKTSTTRTVTATGIGTAEGVPDNLTADVTITTGSPSADEALTQNNNKAGLLLSQLKKDGVADKDVSTTSVDLGPTFDKKGNITGYVVNNSIRIKFRDLDTAGAKLDTLVRIGGNNARIGGVRLGFNNDDKLETKARVDAVKRAKAQVKQMVEAGGGTLGKVRTISEVAVPVGYPSAQAFALSDSAIRSSVPVAAGSQELTVRVKVVFEITG
jgi:uncharacterized protein YggE